MTTTILTTQGELRAHKHNKPGYAFQCGDCHEVKPLGGEGLGTGYGYFGPATDASKPICYACCGLREAAEMRELGVATLYLEGSSMVTKPFYQVTNWPGTLKLVPAWVSVSKRGGGFGCQRTDVRFVFEGQQWHGVNRGDNQILRCRRLKDQA